MKSVEKWKVKKVINSRWNRKSCNGRPNLKCTVRWIGYNEPTEFPAAWLENVQKVINNFYRQYPYKPGFEHSSS
jgi:hypothetical protein